MESGFAAVLGIYTDVKDLCSGLALRTTTMFRKAQVVASLLFPLAATQSVISLVGNDWTLSNTDLNISVPAHLPSQVHLDLFAASVIEDP